MIIKEILQRRSVRQYKKEPVPEQYIIEIIKAAQFAPSAHNNRAVEFVVVKDEQTKEQLAQVAGQPFVKEAPVVIVPCTDSQKTDFAVEDLSVACQNIFLQAVSLGLGTVWKNIKGGNREQKVKEILGIPDHYIAINIIPLGWPLNTPLPYSDDDFDKTKIHYEHW